VNDLSSLFGDDGTNRCRCGFCRRAGDVACETVSQKKRSRRNRSELRKGEIKMSTSATENPKIVSREEWLAARRKLLAKKKLLNREREALAAERRQLPWVKVEKELRVSLLMGTRYR
jgi:hypothetical protein